MVVLSCRWVYESVVRNDLGLIANDLVTSRAEVLSQSDPIAALGGPIGIAQEVAPGSGTTPCVAQVSGDSNVHISSSPIVYNWDFRTGEVVMFWQVGGFIHVSLVVVFVALLVSCSGAAIAAKPGVNYGQLGNNLPKPHKSAELIKTLKAGRVKIYDANPKILKSLQNTSIQVSIMVPNEIITSISTNQTIADQWVRSNVVKFYPKTKIRYILVGNEILSQPDNVTWYNLVPAMGRIRKSLVKYKLKKIKVGTPLAMDCLETSFPPSSGKFRSSVTGSVIGPLLRFINRTKSFFFIDVYTYFAWIADPVNVKLGYALLEPNVTSYTDPVSGLVYNNLLEQMLDALYFAMKRAGYPETRIFIAETGWPNGGDIDQIGGNIYNAAVYNRNVVKWLTRKPAPGTPLKPGIVFPSFIFALYNENLKPGPGTERHFGLLYPNGTSIYEIDLSGKTLEYPMKLPEPTNNVPYKGKIWCMVARGANTTALGGALSYACGQGNGTCDSIRPGGKCFKPESLVWHANYAFSSYWAQFRKFGGSCYFNGLAVQTAKDPSFGSCKFPSVTL
ncbi:probable glucan endo-1,3-beta-glucosidase A6 [Rutidosis leptorrhynchoides]|uniref:probable glucan endo-1,3-beta-glucosidase A6 n=1 Tax=Rutidosis leptorrhynchoides TaxID=125765 RepID=UPI003A99EED3